MPEASPRATAPRHDMPGSRRAIRQQTIEPTPVTDSDTTNDATEVRSTPEQVATATFPTIDRGAGATSENGVQRNVARRARKRRPDPAPPSENLTNEQRVRRARLAAMAAPRPTNSPALAALRRILRDQALMAQVMATVDQWQPLTDEQRDTIVALLNPMRHQD